MRARSCRVILVNWKNAPLTLRAAVQQFDRL